MKTDCGEFPQARESEFQANISMTATGALGGFGAGFLNVKMITADTVETDLPALGIIQRPVPAIIINPQRRKQPKDQESIE